nr:unnamed protein product [Digitaria exilis]
MPPPTNPRQVSAGSLVDQAGEKNFKKSGVERRGDHAHSRPIPRPHLDSSPPNPRSLPPSSSPGPLVQMAASEAKDVGILAMDIYFPPTCVLQAPPAIQSKYAHGSSSKRPKRPRHALCVVGSSARGRGFDFFARDCDSQKRRDVRARPSTHWTPSEGAIPDGDYTLIPADGEQVPEPDAGADVTNPGANPQSEQEGKPRSMT